MNTKRGKDAGTKAAVKELMGTAPVQRRDQETETAPARKIYHNARNPSVNVAIRMRKSDKDALVRHAKLKGMINLSTFIRMIIAEYMDRNGIL